MARPGEPSLTCPTSVRRRFGDLRFHTDGEILALGWNAEGEILSVEEPGLLRLWDASGQAVRSIFLSDVETLWQFSGDTRLLASASNDLTLWSTAEGQLLKTLPQSSWVTALAFTADSAYLATGHDDGVTRLWNTATFERVHAFQGSRWPISALAFSRDGTKLAVASEDRVISLWEVQTGKPAGILTGHTDRIQSLVWHPNGQLLASAGWDTTARIWNVQSLEPVILLNDHADQVYAMAFNPDGTLLACSDSEYLVHIWKPDGSVVGVFAEHEDEIRCMVFSPDGEKIATAGADKVIQVWDPRQNRPLSGQGRPASVRSRVVLAGNGARLASTRAGTALDIWDTNTGQLVHHCDVKSSPLAASPDGHLLATGGSGNRVILWDAETGKLVRSFDDQKGRATALAFSPDSRLLASASDLDGLVWLWNIETGEPVLVIPEAADNCLVESLAFHPQGTMLAAGGIDWLSTSGSDGAVCLWNISEPGLITTFDGGTSCLAFHPNGRWLAGASLTDIVFVWDIEKQTRVAELQGHDDNVTAVAYSPDGKWLASASVDRTIRLWTPDSCEPVEVFPFDTPIKDLCFSPDSRFLYTANGNTTCYQLDLAELLD
ncbi:MAG: hypothetical protein KatS3mg105_1567 [Gemmatales bacterium]|nr:MAG: hypothetical protein KatS3mg105_1567 [Gemmatales bacterium]